MIRDLRRALVATVVLAVLTGLVYPLAITGIAQLTMRSKANGSIVRVGGAAVGSRLIGQQWSGREWFYGRPSAVGYDASTSGGSNLGPTSRGLADRITKRANKILTLESPYHPGLTVARIPADLLLASASGLDPDISPGSAQFQAPRIAAVRGIPVASVRALIRRLTRRPLLGLFGSASVDVLELNLALARL